MVTWKEIAEANEAIRTTTITHKDKNGNDIGKEYAEVNQRVKAFRMCYPQGWIRTEMIFNESGLCIFRASVGAAETELATGTAYEKETSSFINKTSYLENCVPITTQILTEDGWKFYYQLRLGERVWTLNMDTKQMELNPVERINVYTDRPALRLSTSRFVADCTPEHKWIVRGQYCNVHKVKTTELRPSHKIVQAVPQTYFATERGRELGWLMCDCDVNETKNGMASTAYISQSKYVEDITRLFGVGRKTKKYSETWKDNYEWVVSASRVRSVLGHFGMATYRDLPMAMLKADINDVAGCYESMMKADGEMCGFSSTYPELIEAMQIMCVRLGIATGVVRSRMKKNATRPIYTLPIKQTDGAWFSEIKVTNLPPQDVWCPTVPNGTWVMRQNGMVTLTSNCETSAVGRALGFAGFGIDTSIASAEEVQNAVMNQTPEEPKEPRKASAKQIEILSKVYKDENLQKLLSANGIEKIEDLPMKKASDLIKKIYERKGGKKDGE